MKTIDHDHASSPGLVVAQASHSGLERETNEDSFGWFSIPAGELLIVSDGMGGAAGGEIAAKTAVDAFHQYMAATVGDPETCLRQALLAADQAVCHQVVINPSLAGLGSTIVALLLQGREAWFIHVGDSRLYRFSEGRLEQLTNDHSYVQELVEAGEITAKQAENHEERHILTQSLGGTIDESRLKVGHISGQPGDMFLLSTDGLHGSVPKADISHRLQGATSLQDLARKLIKSSLNAGGMDNVTVQLVCLPPRKVNAPLGRITQKMTFRPSGGFHRRSCRVLWLAGLALLVLSGTTFYFWSKEPPAPPPTSESISSSGSDGQAPDQPPLIEVPDPPGQKTVPRPLESQPVATSAETPDATSVAEDAP